MWIVYVRCCSIVYQLNNSFYMRIKKIAFLLLFTLATLAAKAQKFDYIIDFGVNFDNLEGSNPYESTRTLFGAKLAPQVGFELAENHKIMAGADLVQNFGDSNFPTQIDYTLYYRFDNKKYGAIFGSLPRTYSIMEYPRSFFREDYYFYDTNIEGLMLQYKNEESATSAEFFYDWYGIDHDENIDQFLLVGAVRHKIVKNNLLTLGADMLLNHFLNENYLVDAYLLERFQSNIFLSSDLRDVISEELDFFELKAALLTCSENKRMHEVESGWNHATGVQVGLKVGYKRFGLTNDYYHGKGQMQYYEQYGTDFYPGSTFYAAESYNRADLFYEWKNSFLTLRADMIFHITPSTVANQQMLTVRINL